MKYALILLLLTSLLLPVKEAKAQTPEVTQLILNIQKLNQLRKILKELKAGYDILFKGYTTIKDISKGNFKLHEAFLDGLLEVSPAVKRYKRIAEIVEFQVRLISEYRTALGHFQSGEYFNKDELDYMERVYSRLISQSLKNMDALTMVLTAKKMRMSDDERLSAIDKIHEEMQDKLVFLRHFNSTAATLGLQRAKEFAEVETSAQLNGVKP
ncbi:TerB family tellurite resistance protein [Dyadobacter chenwenxiniae]|uniref:TerB family tellurite resistance protein n=1 Tax=Dyadobacter chenwenxiniae TaxID=2906456 RepID=A0A9X1PER5_9BACT|nr:TerB family tellurite resistance protein [Dyadobacter chenwenxiniae]MCF0059865.1 TerB family tellurite resistance protein [Dyadobacter chenwenxiniae]UON85605.1 TerB family tellurite resistance protein [Dyadobacter chenwenxiniae]